MKNDVKPTAEAKDYVHTEANENLMKTVCSPSMRQYTDVLRGSDVILRASSPEKSFKINERYKNILVDNPDLDDAREISNEDKGDCIKNHSLDSFDLQSVPVTKYNL